MCECVLNHNDVAVVLGILVVFNKYSINMVQQSR